jgi:hypothetical protein
MKRMTVRSLAVLTALVLLGVSQARADLATFSYEWSTIPNPPTFTGPDSGGGSGTVSLSLNNPVGTPGSGSTTTGSLPGFLVEVGSFTSNSSTDPDHPDVFKSPINLKVHLTDTGSGADTTLSFTGNIQGELTSTSSTVTTTFDTPASQGAALGNFNYKVTIDPSLVAVPDPGGATGLITAFVSATLRDNNTPPPNPGPKPSQTPEPSSLVLGATALSLLGLARRCRRPRLA